jgi:hypothetical protein
MSPLQAIRLSGAAAVATMLILTPSAMSATARSATTKSEESAARAAEQVSSIDRETTPQAVAVLNEPEATCPRQRRKFWIEGEGWVVRRVAACR